MLQVRLVLFCEFEMEKHYYKISFEISYKIYKISFDPVLAKCCSVVMAARWVGGRYEGHSDGML